MIRLIVTCRRVADCTPRYREALALLDVPGRLSREPLEIIDPEAVAALTAEALKTVKAMRLPKMGDIRAMLISLGQLLTEVQTCLALPAFREPTTETNRRAKRLYIITTQNKLVAMGFTVHRLDTIVKMYMRTFIQI